jgi:crotonobetainyl-CoA:carnitine CoA-transferase CaiB-like acyl-CoA transferase
LGDHFSLDDLLVIEAGEAIAPAYASNLLAELGTTVIRIDPHAGDGCVEKVPDAFREVTA